MNDGFFIDIFMYSSCCHNSDLTFVLFSFADVFIGLLVMEPYTKVTNPAAEIVPWRSGHSFVKFFSPGYEFEKK